MIGPSALKHNCSKTDEVDSFIFSFGFFIGGVAVFGPEKHQGDVFHFMKMTLSDHGVLAKIHGSRPEPPADEEEMIIFM